ncbi:MAG TPA: SBBP repeat-containing protein [Pyrinomonadaceae bacterium]|nr:SBBP repeat-containing protein [Pyrinomonadaceae bacterium]
MNRILGKVGFTVAAVAFASLIVAVFAVTKNNLFLTEVSAENASGNQILNKSAIENLEKSAVYFEENRGQFHEKVRYFARGMSGYDLFLTATDAVYVLRESPKSKVQNSKSADLQNPKSLAVYVSLAGANENSVSVGLETLTHRTNYLKGAESDWRTAIPNHQSVRMNEIYQGIDMIWRGENSGAIADFLIQPNADPNQIEWEIKGAKAVELDAEGDLLIKTEYGEITRQKPFAYQETEGFRQTIESSFVLTEKANGSNGKSFNVKFQIDNYDRTKPLTIDSTANPTANFTDLSFSTFLGGSGLDEGLGIAADSAENVYVTGRTFSTDFPTTAGTIDTTHNGNLDVFVTKFNAAGTNLIYSTFLGGSAIDVGFGIAVDAAGNAIITGSTESTNYPTAAALDSTHNGLADVFVTKLNSTGSALTYSTFLGGNQGDDGRAVVIDSSGNSFICGNTRSSNYPTSGGAFDTVHNGSQDVFVTKINASGSAIGYSTFLGGSAVDGCNGIAADSAGNVFVTGQTQSSAFPVTAGAFDTTHNGSSDVFVTKINAAGSALSFSTFLGDSSADVGFGIAIDSAGNAFVTGQTQSQTFPTTVGAFNETHNGVFGTIDVFVTKFNSNGSALVYSTFLGGAETDIGNAIAVNPAGDAYVAGYTQSSAFPTTAGSFDTTHNGEADVFVTKFNAAGSALTHSTFVGDSLWDSGAAIAIDATGNAFITGQTQSPAFPTNGGFDTTHNGNFDVFAAKLQLTPIIPGILQLSSANYGGNEGATLAATVNRVSGSDGIVGVTYTLTDNTATGGAACGAGIDYINPGVQTLVFGDSVTSQPINVTLCTDLINEPSEAFTITLSTPTGGATLGMPTSATATIANVPPPLNGTYTVGASGADYPSLTNAGGIFEAINNNGASGAITINIITDLSGETGAVALNPIAGNPPILIKPSGAPRIVSGNAPIAVIRISGADNVTIDGSTTASVVGGNSVLRELTVMTLNTVTNTAAIHIGSTVESSNNNVIRNVNVSGNGSTQTLAGISSGANIAGGLAVFPNNGTRIENCSIQRVAYGVYAIGASAANPNTGTVITENDLSGTGTNRIGIVGIFVGNDNGAQINQNNIGGMDSGLAGDVIGIAAGATGVSVNGTVSSSINNAVIARNRINGVRQDNTFSAIGILVAGSANGTNTIANNMISGVIGDSANSDLPAGIFIAGANSSTTRVFYNSVSMTGDRSALPTPSTSMNPSFAIAITGTDPNIELKNNIFYTSQTASTGGAAASSFAIGIASNTFANLDSNYNAFYSSGANDGGFRTATLSNAGGTNHATLAAWRTATGGTATDDFNSAEGDPLFLNPASDLHVLNTTTLVVDKGTPVSILDDFDGQIRSIVGLTGGVPDIGADESTITTAANASIEGRISTANGVGIRNAIVEISGGNLMQPITAKTGSFGYFRFEDLETAQTYVLTVNSKRFLFSNPSRVITLNESISDFNFIAEP